MQSSYSVPLFLEQMSYSLESYYESMFTYAMKAPEKPIKRLWSKKQVEDLYIATNSYCFLGQIDVNCLTLDDYTILSTFTNKSPAQCMKKIRELTETKSLAPGAWSFNEDELLKSLVLSKVNKWGFIADYLNSSIHSGIRVRSGKQCKERWINHLDPTMKRDKWTIEEDLKVLEIFKNMGKKWCKISKIIKNRTDSAIKNRVKSLIYKHKQELNESKDDNFLLDSLIAKIKETIDRSQ